MDSFEVRIRAFNPPNPDRGRELDITVNSEARVAVIPSSVAEDLDIPTLWYHEFEPDDGIEGPRKVGVAGFAYEGRQCSSALVILGEEGDPTRLGRSNAEELGLVRIERIGECPNCGTVNAIPIVYGLPGREAIQKARLGQFVLGGCLTYAGMPKYACPTCHAGLPELVACVIYATQS